MEGLEFIKDSFGQMNGFLTFMFLVILLDVYFDNWRMYIN